MWDRFAVKDDLRDRRVQSVGGRLLGRVDTVTMEPASGEVLYAIVRVRRRLGVPYRRYAVPRARLIPAYDLAAFTLDAEPEELMAAPALDPSQPPSVRIEHLR